MFAKKHLRWIIRLAFPRQALLRALPHLRCLIVYFLNGEVKAIFLNSVAAGIVYLLAGVVPFVL